jgi:hypothetical protein
MHLELSLFEVRRVLPHPIICDVFVLVYGTRAVAKRGPAVAEKGPQWPNGAKDGT